MLFFFIIILAVILFAMAFAGAVLCLDEPSVKLRLLFIALLLCGGVVAWWCTFHLEYQYSATIRIAGAPVPVAIFQLENGDWVDYVGGPGWIIDLVVTPCAFVAPASLSLMIRAYRRHKLEQLPGFEVLPRRDSGSL